MTAHSDISSTKCKVFIQSSLPPHDYFTLTFYRNNSNFFNKNINTTFAFSFYISTFSNLKVKIKVLTFIVVFGGDSEDCMLYIFILVDFRLVQLLVEVRRVVILVGDANADELCHCK